MTFYGKKIWVKVWRNVGKGLVKNFLVSGWQKDRRVHVVGKKSLLLYDMIQYNTDALAQLIHGSTHDLTLTSCL